MFRRIGWFGLAVVAALVVALVATLSSAERTLSSVTTATRTFTPYSLELRQPALSLRPFDFRAELLQLRMQAAAPGAPALLTIQDLDLQMPLGRLLRGRSGAGDFRAANVTYFLDETTGEEEVDLEALLAPLGWLPDRVDIGSIHLISRADNVWVFPLLNVSARRTETGSLALITEAEIGERRVVLEALADWLLAPEGGHRLDLKAAVFGPQDDSELLLEGRAEARDTDLSYVLSLAGSYRRVSDFVSAFEPEAFVFPGNLTIDGSLVGDLHSYRLDIRALEISEANAFSFAAEGTLQQDDGGPARIDVSAHGTAAALERILALPEEIEGVLTESELILSIGGSLEEPKLTELGIALFGAGDTEVRLSSPDLDLNVTGLERIESLE